MILLITLITLIAIKCIISTLKLKVLSLLFKPYSSLPKASIPDLFATILLILLGNN